SSVVVSGQPGLSDRSWVRLVRIDAVLREGPRYYRSRDFTVVGQRFERGHNHVVAINLEELTQLLTKIRAPEPISPKHAVGAFDKGSDLVREGLHVVRGRHGRALTPFQAQCHVGLALRELGMQQVPTLYLHALPAQLGEARAAPDVRQHSEIALE